VARSVVEGAKVGQNARLDGCIVGRGASLRDGCILNEGAVIGAGTILGEGTVVDARVRVWPGKALPPGSRISETLITGQPRNGLRFSGGGAIRGEISVDLTPEICFAIGSALGTEGRIGVGCSGEAASRLAARAIACGVSAVGGLTLELDCPFEAAAGYAADLYGLQRTVFVHEQEHHLRLKVYGPRGLPLTRNEERAVEAALASGELRRAPAVRIGNMLTSAGTAEAYVSAAASWGDLGKPPDFAVEVRGRGGAGRALRCSLELMHVPLAKSGRGVPAFETGRGGTVLYAEDEDGRSIAPEQLLTILVMLEFEAGTDTVAVPYAAPVALDLLANSFGATLLRLGRDTGAAPHYYRRPYLRDAVFAACRLVGNMAALRQSLHSINQRAPQFQTAHREVPITGDRAALMQTLAKDTEPGAAELVEGLRLPVGHGWVHVSPASSRSVLKIHSESTSMEAAEEICLDFARRLEALDKKAADA